MDIFFDIAEASIAKSGEELCGDQIRIHRGDGRTTIVLSDGLGNGVKASILGTLTAEIIINMLKADVALPDVMETVIGTLPICQERRIAYATFTIIQLNHADHSFEAINFDNPRVFFLRKGKRVLWERHEETHHEKKIYRLNDRLERGDFLAVCSDGVVHAGLGGIYNFGWGWENIAAFLEDAFPHAGGTARAMVQRLMNKTVSLYGETVGDDASVVGILARERKALMVFTGPPLDEVLDPQMADRLLEFPGRRVVCGGTTANIVGEHIGQTVETVIESMTRDVPPVGKLPGVDLLTEGIVTMTRTLDILRGTGGNMHALPRGKDGATLLAAELLGADSIFFLVGGQINEWYQNPLLPKDISIRKMLIRDIVEFLRAHHREVTVEYC